MDKDKLSDTICERLCDSSLIGAKIKVAGLTIKVIEDGYGVFHRGCKACSFMGFLGDDCFLNENGESVVPCSPWNNNLGKPLVFEFVEK